MRAQPLGDSPRFSSSCPVLAAPGRTAPSGPQRHVTIVVGRSGPAAIPPYPLARLLSRPTLPGQVRNAVRGPPPPPTPPPPLTVCPARRLDRVITGYGGQARRPTGAICAAGAGTVSLRSQFQICGGSKTAKPARRRPIPPDRASPSQQLSVELSPQIRLGVRSQADGPPTNPAVDAYPLKAEPKAISTTGSSGPRHVLASPRS